MSHDSHRQAAEMHDQAAKAHRDAAAHDDNAPRNVMEKPTLDAYDASTKAHHFSMKAYREIDEDHK